MRAVGGLLLCAAALLLPAPAALAIIDDTDGGPVERPCLLGAYNFTLQVSLVQVGLPIAGTAVTINASNAKLVGTKATAAVICEPVSFPLSNFQWQLASVPSGQSASIANAGTLTPRVNLGGPGAYRIRLTPCPSGCKVTLSGRTRTLTGIAVRETTINAVAQLTLPPETQPLLPPLSPPATQPPTFSQSQRDTACQGGGGAIDPQWVTAQRFNGPGDYRMVEGEVEVSKVSAQDNFLNHDSQDQNWDVKPDLPSAGLDQPKPSDSMEMEWELNTMPREIRPTPGDRASTVGYWIFDCGHDPFKTEIHPPVGIATERPRPVQIPSSFRPAGFPNGFGSNVQVPGIVSDIFFNRQSGETTNNCSDTGLHQPSTGLFSGPCIREPHNISRTFTFNVFLPRDPQQRAREAGLNPPPVPLFVGISPTPGLSSGGPDPTFVVRSQNGISWLEVSVNLTGQSAMTYARRVSAAWAYPQTENWGAQRWRIILDRIRVGDDAEPAFDDGDWRFFFNTNNRDREWTKVFDCDECVDDDTTKTLNVQTGGTGLGADTVLFPGQTIFVHTGGFDDETFGDDIGTVFDRKPQASGDFASPSQGGDGSYTLDYRIRPGPAVGSATLTPEARALNEAYTARTPSQCVFTQVQGRGAGGVITPPRAGCGVIAPAQRDPNLTQDWHPDQLILKGVRRGDGELFESEREEFTLQGISLAGFKTLVASKRAKNPAQLNKFLAEIRAELARIPAKLHNDYADLVGTLDKSLPPSDVARAVPPGFRASIKKPIVPITPARAGR